MAEMKRDTLITKLLEREDGADIACRVLYILSAKKDFAERVNNYDITISRKMKTVKNLQSGLDVEIPVDTPSSCDPSSETYWSI